MEKKWSKAKGKQHRQHVREMQEIEQKLAARRQAGSADEEVEYKETVSAQQTAVNKQVSQEGTQRLNTRNRQLRGKQFWNQNKKKSVTRIGSLAAFDTEMGKFKLEETVSDAETMASIAQTYFASNRRSCEQTFRTC